MLLDFDAEFVREDKSLALRLVADDRRAMGLERGEIRQIGETAVPIRLVPEEAVGMKIFLLALDIFQVGSHLIRLDRLSAPDRMVVSHDLVAELDKSPGIGKEVMDLYIEPSFARIHAKKSEIEQFGVGQGNRGFRQGTIPAEQCRDPLFAEIHEIDRVPVVGGRVLPGLAVFFDKAETQALVALNKKVDRFFQRRIVNVALDLERRRNHINTGARIMLFRVPDAQLRIGQRIEPFLLLCIQIALPEYGRQTMIYRPQWFFWCLTICIIELQFTPARMVER